MVERNNTGVASCTFELNGQAVSILKCEGGLQYDAFSGNGAPYVNNPKYQSTVQAGPLPVGRYYIVDRQSGGRLGWLRESIQSLGSTDKSGWFGLYRDDGKIDDHTIVEGIGRGAFRLHPMGPLGISEGCVTLHSAIGFEELSAFLRSKKGEYVPGTQLKYYGVLEVSASERARRQ
jgi:hypothetical protein